MSSATSSPAWARPRWATPRSPERASYGEAVAKSAAALGFELMPWQRLVADTAMEVDPEAGRLAYRTVIVTVPRQSGKTTLLLAIAVHRALGFGERQNIIYSAQTGVDARKKFIEDWVPILERSPLASAFKVRLTNGHESVRWKNGSRHGIAATTEKAGHGQTLDLGFIDEAFALVDGRMEQAFGPAMITRPQPQLWIVSTAGTDESVYLNEKVELGRELVERDVRSDIAYFEWSADPEAEPGDVNTWIGCMPALRHEGNPNGTTPIEAVAAEYARMPLPEFRRAYLNLRDAKRHDSVIEAHDWAACRAEESRAVDPVAFAIDVTPDRSGGAIAAAGQSDVDADLSHVEVVDQRSGTRWIVPRMVELVERHRPTAVVLDAAGPAGSLLAPLEGALEELGVEVTVVSTREATQACGGIYDAVKDRSIRHIGQPALEAVVDGADRRLGGGAWLWSRKSSSVDISPLVATTLALWGHMTAEDEDPTEGVH